MGPSAPCPPPSQPLGDCGSVRYRAQLRLRPGVPLFPLHSSVLSCRGGSRPPSQGRGQGYLHSDPLAVTGHLSVPRHLLLRYGVGNGSAALPGYLTSESYGAWLVPIPRAWHRDSTCAPVPGVPDLVFPFSRLRSGLGASVDSGEQWGRKGSEEGGTQRGRRRHLPGPSEITGHPQR